MAFFIKEVIRTRLVESGEEKTVVDVETWRSRKYGRGTKLFSVRVTSKGVEIL